jgi:hypothetical protein
MNNHRTRKFAPFGLLFLFLILAFTITVKAQASQQPVTITINDEVAGGIAEGVTVVIEDADGIVVQTFQTTAENSIHTSLSIGNYTIKVQIPLFGVPSVLGEKSINVTQPTDIEVKISAVIVPVKYLTLVTYSVTAAAGSSVAFFSLRYILKLRKTRYLVAAAKVAWASVGVSAAVAVGSSVTVHPNSNVLLTFNKVQQAGAATAVPLSNYPPLPKGVPFMGAVWDIKTTAAFAGVVLVGILFDGSALTDEQKKKLRVYRIDLDQKSSWKDVTATIDIENNIAYGTTDHFSGFGIH